MALTYEFSPSAFERVFARILRLQIQVDVIAGTGCAGSKTHARYWRANWGGTFHPKLICLVAGSDVCVGVGSSNLTSGGLREHLEVWKWFEGSDCHSVLSGVAGFLSELVRRKIVPARASVDEFVQALPEPQPSKAFLSMFDACFVDQVLSRLRDDIDAIDIVAPINGDPSALIRRLRNGTGARHVSIYSDKNPMPLVGGVNEYFQLGRPTRDEDDDSRAITSVHAKLFAFRRRGSVDLFWGSANPSFSGWLAPLSRSNIETLVHTRMADREWRHFLKSIPAGYTWQRTEPRKVIFEDEGRETLPWQLLHGIWEREALFLSASGPGRVRMQIRSETNPRPVGAELRFDGSDLRVPFAIARRFGFSSKSCPQWLEWRVKRTADWRRIPVNRADAAGGDTDGHDVADQLYWEYSGRALRRSGLNGTSGGDEAVADAQLSNEEWELTHSDHQGELDEFVLKWRLVARRVANASGDNPRLRAFHVRSVRKRVAEAAAVEPGAWPEFRIRFICQLLDREWPR